MQPFLGPTFSCCKVNSVNAPLLLGVSSKFAMKKKRGRGEFKNAFVFCGYGIWIYDKTEDKC